MLAALRDHHPGASTKPLTASASHVFKTSNPDCTCAHYHTTVVFFFQGCYTSSICPTKRGERTSTGQSQPEKTPQQVGDIHTLPSTATTAGTRCSCSASLLLRMAGGGRTTSRHLSLLHSVALHHHTQALLHCCGRHFSGSSHTGWTQNTHTYTRALHYCSIHCTHTTAAASAFCRDTTSCKNQPAQQQGGGKNSGQTSVRCWELYGMNCCDVVKYSLAAGCFRQTICWWCLWAASCVPTCFMGATSIWMNAH